MATSNSPPRESTIHPHLEQGRVARLHSEDNVPESPQRQPINPKKRKKGNSSPADNNIYDFILGKISTIEQNIKDLSAAVHSNTNRPARNAPHGNEETRDRDTGTILHQFGNLTKKERETFYTNYGKLKELKLKFSKDELNKKLSTEEFTCFKDLRNKLTFWVKMGLGASRQLEELNMPIHRTVPKPPLLTTGYMARMFERETDIYLQEIAIIRLNFYEGMFKETKKILTRLNEEITNHITEASTNLRELILAKAFRSAVAGSNDLFKNNYKEFQQVHYYRIFAYIGRIQL